MLYRPVGLILGLAGGAAASALFTQAWKAVGRGSDAPDALDEDRSWREILIAAAIQGAIFSVVRAAVDRGGAIGVRRLTGTWPGGS
ncbi:membrane protein [Streptomyces roseolilacinus]|uniref:Membrane protein n=2 Tax=Streptomyces roseolilacinus TaxID=66904 RepID=A0A918B3Z1_9ACTN|nr:membrane protein [Streptomyces roseolilacinus]